MATVTEYANMRLTPAQAETLDALAALMGVNRSEAIRRVLDAPLSTLVVLTASTVQKETADQLVAGRAAARRHPDMRVSDVTNNRNT